MADEKALTTKNQYDVSKFQKPEHDETAAAAVAGPGYMPRLQLMTGRSEICQKGEFQPNHYALIDGSNYIDLGKNPDILAFCWRPCAMDSGGDDFVISLDPKFDDSNPPQPTGLFLEIMKKSAQANSRCMYGPQYLCWVASLKRFCTFFLGTKSNRKEAPKLNARLCQPTTLGAREITSKKFGSWFVPDIKPCSTPFNGPNSEEVDALAKEFNNPKQDEPELADDTGGERER